MAAADGLKGKVALVTGTWGMRSIGRAIALRLAGSGAHVVVSDVERRPDAISPDEHRAGWRGFHSVADEARALGVQAHAIQCDLTTDAEIGELVAETRRAMGKIDILVNSARAILPDRPSLMDITGDQWDVLMGVNLRAPHRLSQEAARAMIAAGQGGCIINISSISGKQALPGTWAPYAVSKAGLNMLTEMLAHELAPHGIRVNAICPGWINTNRFMPDEAKQAEAAGISVEELRRRSLSKSAQAIPMKRVGEPEEIAEAAWFLASDASSYVTGQCLCVDGGIVMG